MKQVFRYDADGNFVEPVIIGDNDPIPTNCTERIPKEGLFRPRFSNDDWTEGMSDTDVLNAVKTIKKSQLQQAFQASLFKGFTSTADGTSRTYAIDSAAMAKWTGALSVINSGKITSNITVKDFNGNSVTLTPAQFQQMASDGFVYFNSQEAHLWSLESNVDAATKVSDVNNVTW